MILFPHHKSGDSPTVIKTSRTSVMDADEHDDRSSMITIHRHSPDFRNLADDVAARIVVHLRNDPTGCVYFNPAVSVSCRHPSPEFFKLVKQEQARWCRRASKTFKNHARRKVSSWISPAVVDGIRNQFLDRALCFTGILFIECRMVPHHQWKLMVDAGDKNHILRPCR